MTDTDILQQELRELDQQVITGEEINRELEHELAELNEELERKESRAEHERLVESRRAEVKREAVQARKKPIRERQYPKER